MSLILRRDKGTALTRDELDDNLEYLEQNGGGGGVKSLHYIAALEQTGTDAPVATVIRNDFDGEIVWSRTGVGQYLGTLVGAFTGNVRAIEPSSLLDPLKPGNYTENAVGTTDDAVTLETNEISGGTSPAISIKDGLLKSKDSYIEIIKYLD